MDGKAVLHGERRVGEYACALPAAAADGTFDRRKQRGAHAEAVGPHAQKGGEALRVWMALVAHKGFEAVPVMIYPEAQAKEFELQAGVVTDSLRILDPPR